MRIALFAASALAATAFASPAFAQDSTFTGPHVEVVGGYDHFNDGGTGQRVSSDGVTYGGAAGYDVQVGKLVLGADGEITGSTARNRSTGVVTVGDSLRTSAGRDLYAGGRIGVALAPRVMIYGKAGYTNARVDTRYTNATTTVSDHANAGGYRLGAGAQFNLSNSIYLKGEYRYSNYQKLQGYNIDLDRHQVLGGLGVKF